MTLGLSVLILAEMSGGQSFYLLSELSGGRIGTQCGTDTDGSQIIIKIRKLFHDGPVSI